MDALELKIPPPVVAALIAGAMWGISWTIPPPELTGSVRGAAALVLALLGVGFGLAGLVSFMRVRTTVNPMQPMRTVALVTTGAYRLSRNPMYVGVLLLLTAWALCLAVHWLLAGPVVFVLYMNRFQIAPEERALAALFGKDYDVYKAQVRRWL